MILKARPARPMAAVNTIIYLFIFINYITHVLARSVVINSINEVRGVSQETYR